MRRRTEEEMRRKWDGRSGRNAEGRKKRKEKEEKDGKEETEGELEVGMG